MIPKLFLCKNKHYIVVVIVPNFHLTARSSSFFLAFLLQVYGEPFEETPDTFKKIAKKTEEKLEIEKKKISKENQLI